MFKNHLIKLLVASCAMLALGMPAVAVDREREEAILYIYDTGEFEEDEWINTIGSYSLKEALARRNAHIPSDDVEIDSCADTYNAALPVQDDLGDFEGFEFQDDNGGVLTSLHFSLAEPVNVWYSFDFEDGRLVIDDVRSLDYDGNLGESFKESVEAYCD